MKILDLLIDILRFLMHTEIEKYGLLNAKTITISQRLDKLIYLKQQRLIVNY